VKPIMKRRRKKKEERRKKIELTHQSNLVR